MTTQANDADRRRRRRSANPNGTTMSIADYNDFSGMDDAKALAAIDFAVDIAAGRRPAPQWPATLTPAERVALWRRAAATRQRRVTNSKGDEPI